MSACLETLSPLTSRLLARRAGLHGAAPQSLARAARALHIGVPAARRLERRGLALLRMGFATGGCGGSATSSVTSVAPVSAVVPSIANPNPAAATAGSPFSSGEATAALPSSVPSSLGEGAVRGVQASGGGGDEADRGARGNGVPPAASVADGRDSPANSLADHQSLLLLILALLAIIGGLALIAGQSVIGRRRREPAPAPRRPAERSAPAGKVPVWREDGEEEHAPEGVLRPMRTEARPAAASAPPTEVASHVDEAPLARPGTARRSGGDRPEEAAPAAVTPRAPAASHRPAVRPRQATLAGAALTVLGALLSVRRRR
jgi:hypothetical protein